MILKNYNVEKSDKTENNNGKTKMMIRKVKEIVTV
jgi:hypothetical protein